MPNTRILLIALVSRVAGGLAWASALTTGAGTLTALDYAEIQQLYARYNFTIDASDAEGYAALYTPDGTFNTFTGRDALIQFMKGRNRGHVRHWNTNLMITPTPEGASGAVYLMLLNVSTTPPSVESAGKYADRLVKTPQGWRFKSRQSTRESPADTPPGATPRSPRP